MTASALAYFASCKSISDADMTITGTALVSGFSLTNLQTESSVEQRHYDIQENYVCILFTDGIYGLDTVAGDACLVARVREHQ